MALPSNRSWEEENKGLAIKTAPDPSE